MTFFLFVGLFTLSLKAINIDQQINRIKNAPPQERVQLMNQFKLQLATMNQNQRADAIKGLRSKMHQGQTPSAMSTDHQMQHEPSAHPPAPPMQMRQGEEMSAYQNMNQFQVGQQLPRTEGTPQSRPSHSSPPPQFDFKRPR